MFENGGRRGDFVFVAPWEGFWLTFTPPRYTDFCLQNATMFFGAGISIQSWKRDVSFIVGDVD